MPDNAIASSLYSFFYDIPDPSTMKLQMFRVSCANRLCSLKAGWAHIYPFTLLSAHQNPFVYFKAGRTYPFLHWASSHHSAKWNDSFIAHVAHLHLSHRLFIPARPGITLIQILCSLTAGHLLESKMHFRPLFYSSLHRCSFYYYPKGAQTMLLLEHTALICSPLLSEGIIWEIPHLVFAFLFRGWGRKKSNSGLPADFLCRMVNHDTNAR